MLTQVRIAVPKSLNDKMHYAAKVCQVTVKDAYLFYLSLVDQELTPEGLAVLIGDFIVDKGQLTPSEIWGGKETEG